MVYEWMEKGPPANYEGPIEELPSGESHRADPGCGCCRETAAQFYDPGSEKYGGDASLKQFDWLALGTGILGFLIGAPVGAVLVVVFVPGLAETLVAQIAEGGLGAVAKYAHWG